MIAPISGNFQTSGASNIPPGSLKVKLSDGKTHLFTPIRDNNGTIIALQGNGAKGPVRISIGPNEFNEPCARFDATQLRSDDAAAILNAFGKSPTEPNNPQAIDTKGETWEFVLKK